MSSPQTGAIDAGRVEYVADWILPAVYDLLPTVMNTPESRAMLLAIGLQESRFLARRQIPNGQARGFWQFEEGGGVAGVITHPRSSTWIALACSTLRYPSTVEVCYRAIEHNDTLAGVFARLLLWTLPGPLAARSDAAKGWDQYLAAWRPGKPHGETWFDNFELAWNVVTR